MSVITFSIGFGHGCVLKLQAQKKEQKEMVHMAVSTLGGFVQGKGLASV